MRVTGVTCNGILDDGCGDVTRIPLRCIQATLAKFEELVDDMPTEYVRLYPEFRMGSPFVLGITREGSLYLHGHAPVTDDKSDKSGGMGKN